MNQSVDRRAVLSGLAALSIAPAFADQRQRFDAHPLPFQVAIDPAKIERIRARVRDATWPRTARGKGWELGVDAAWFRDMVGYWGRGYDWQGQQAAINRMPQFTLPVMGKRMHFAHFRSANPDAKPLLMLHGWPYSFYSFSEVAPALARDYHVVIPSLPGSLFSESIADAPRGLRAISAHVHALMGALGYGRYIVQGSDHGAVVADWLALDRPHALLGEQTNLIAFRHKGAEYAAGTTGLADPTRAEKAFVVGEVKTFKQESAYFELQRTRPETIAYAMADSPVGMAAYILDKWQKWTDTRGRGLNDIYGRDRLITEVMLYLVTDSFATSLWPYNGFALEPFAIEPGRKIEVPFGFSGYSDPLNTPPPREFVTHSRSNIVQWEVAPRGGHFPFLEDPKRFVSQVRQFGSIIGAAPR